MRKLVETLRIRDVAPDDAMALAVLLNAVIAEGGTTALEETFTPEKLDETYLTGPTVYCCFVAVCPTTEQIEGFQTLGRYKGLPDGVADIGTFARLGGAQRGIGSMLFAATHARALSCGLVAINATIRADNAGGLSFYSKLGFEDFSVTPAVPLKNGTKVDRINKRYSLTPEEMN